MKRFKKILSIVLAIVLCVSLFGGISSVSVFANSNEEIKSAARAYVAENGNDSSMSGLLSAVKNVEPDATLVAEDYFIYHAVDGVYDEDPDIEDRLSIPGHDGYVSAIFTVGTERISILETIPHEEENLGVLTKISTSDENAGEVFTITNSNLLGIKETATEYQKIVIDSNIVHISGFNYTSFISKAQVLILRNSGAYGGTDTSNGGLFRTLNGKGFISLKAVYMDDCIKNGTYFSAKNTTQNDFFPMPTLKYFRFPENGTVFSTNYRDFFAHANYGTCLENVNTHVLGTLHNNSFLNCTSLYSVYLGESTTGSEFTGGPATRVKMTYEQQQTATFARAAVLAMISLEKLGENRGEPEKALSAIDSALDGKIDGVTIDYNMNEGHIKLSNATDSYYIEYANDKIVNDISITASGQEIKISPVFSYKTMSYNAYVLNDVTSVTIDVSVTDGATILSGNGIKELENGANIIKVVAEAGEAQVTYTVTIIRSDGTFEAKLNDAKKIVQNYVNANKNTSVAGEVLRLVQTVIPDVKMDFESDFYIKHAVPAVKDNTADYPLDIKGSNGAIAAVFEYNNFRAGFTCAFEYDTEIIDIKETAVVGDKAFDEYFEYDENGNVIAYSGTADKIVFPEGYSGTMAQLSDLTTVQEIKVVIIDNTATTKLLTYGFMNWDGLIAVQMKDQTVQSAFGQGNKFETTSGRVFANCDNLKYVKFPSSGVYDGWATIYLPYGCFENCTKLENFNFPTVNNTANHWVGFHTFYASGIRELVFPQYSSDNDSSKAFAADTILQGRRNLHFYTEKMTFCRAAAYATASLLEKNEDLSTDELFADVKTAIKGSIDAQEFADGLTYGLESQTNTDTMSSTQIYILCGAEKIVIDYLVNKGLESLELNYDITPAFSSDVTEYKATVPYGEEINVSAKATFDSSANVEKTNDKIYITVTTADNEEIQYNISLDFDYRNAMGLVAVRKALLGHKEYAQPDINNDTEFDIRDLVNLKKSIVNLLNIRSELNGVELSQFAIVYSEDDHDYSKRAAEYIQSQILERTDIELEVITDSEESATEYEIVVGETSREISSRLDADTEGTEFAILAEEKQIALEGEYFIIAAAAYYFVDTYIPEDNFKATIPMEVSIHEPIVEEAENFIVLIGDGMGTNQTKLFDVMTDVSGYSDGESEFYGYYLEYLGYQRTNSLTGTTDSAAAGTALATGHKTHNKVIGLDGSGNVVQSLTELAASKGMSTAVMSTEWQGGATPSTFSAHAGNRNNDDATIEACQRNMRENYATIIKCGFDDYTKQGIEAIEGYITSTLDTLSKNENGFFMMYEEAHIDKHGHNQDIDNCFLALIRFNQAIARFMEYAFYNPNTFVLITADHETGSLLPNDEGGYSYNSGTHSGVDVPIFVYGYGAELFADKTIENVQIPMTIASFMGVYDFGDQTTFSFLR